MLISINSYSARIVFIYVFSLHWRHRARGAMFRVQLPRGSRLNLQDIQPCHEETYSKRGGEVTISRGPIGSRLGLQDRTAGEGPEVQFHWGPIGPRLNLFKTCFEIEISHHSAPESFSSFSPGGLTCQCPRNPPCCSPGCQVHCCFLSSPIPPRLQRVLLQITVTQCIHSKASFRGRYQNS